MQRYQGQGGEVGWGGLGHGIDWLTVAVARRLAYRRLAGARLQRGVLRAAKYFFSSGARCWVQQCAKTEAAKSLLGWFLVCYMPLACEFQSRGLSRDVHRSQDLGRWESLPLPQIRG